MAQNEQGESDCMHYQLSNAEKSKNSEFWGRQANVWKLRMTEERVRSVGSMEVRISVERRKGEGGKVRTREERIREVRMREERSET